MLEIMQFIFSSFWTWLGTVIMLAVIFSPLTKLINIRIGKDK